MKKNLFEDNHILGYYIPVGIGEGLPSNQEIVQIYGFKPIYDSGYKKWKLKVK